MKLLFSQIFLFYGILVGSALAAEPQPISGNNAIKIKGNACEKFTENEAKSTVRVRVTDKASFLAVNGIDEVNTLSDDLNEHDYNVLVYGLVDNAIEDMSVQTTKQDAEQLCVEVSGYVSLDNILKAVDELPQAEETQPAPQETMTEIVKEVNTSYSELPNKPTGVIPPSEEEVIEKHKAPLPQTNQLPLQNDDADIVDSTQTKAVQQPVAEPVIDDKKGLVFVEPTEFFNKTTSDVHAKTVRDMFVNDDDYFVTDKRELADYIIKSKVLRAKVTPINSSTNRLQMVVSVEAEFPDEKASIVEHQNRFVLFNSDENEQEVAFRLLKKLFAAAGEKVKDKVDQAERRRRPDKALPDIITPAKS